MTTSKRPRPPSIRITPLPGRLTRDQRAWQKWAKRVFGLQVDNARACRMDAVAREEGIEAP